MAPRINTSLASSLLLTVVMVCCARGADTQVQLLPVIYDEQPDHVWNRLHAALLIRTGPDGKDYGGDRLEPLLWNESRHLLQGHSEQKAVAVLKEFNRDEGEQLIDDPVKHAILQRDLWLVANWLSGTSGSEGRLAEELGKAIRRLALSPRKIANLPDNFAAAVASKRHADHFDATRPEQAYLPPDLFQDNGPWVCVGRTDGLTAPFHFNSPFNNSVFLVFLKLPGGREETLDFLTRLNKLEQLLLPNVDEDTKLIAPFLPHPDFPAWPNGTEVALVRRALLIDSNRRVVASPLTESVQIRVITAETPALTKDVLEIASSRRPPAEWQSPFEFQLRRIDLFAGESGGLREVSDERDFKTGFGSHGWDEFDQPLRNDQPFVERSQPFPSHRASCMSCHSLPGAFSFSSVPGFAFSLAQRIDDIVTAQRPPGPTTVAEVENRAVKWKESQPALTALIKRLRDE